MYVKYIMSSFLIISALSMLIQFSSFIISEMNKLEKFKENRALAEVIVNHGTVLLIFTFHL